MPTDALTPLRFAPIFKSALWGGSRLRSLFGDSPSDDPTGEAWVLSDQGDNLSTVVAGARAGSSLRELLERFPERILGRGSLVNGRFPLLLKFIHARQPLSVQVHPNNARAQELEGPRAVGKTEAWVVLEADPTARLYSGLLPGITPERLRRAIASGDFEELLYVHAPQAGDCLFLPAGAVHAIGGGLVLFEVQQTSDITYRLYDWGRTDPKTGRGRDLHIEKGLACVDFSLGPCRPTTPTDESHGRIRPAKLVECNYFSLMRWDTDRPFRAGAAGQCRVLVGIGGRATLRHAGIDYPIGVGDVWLLPAEVGACECVPRGTAVILECGLPQW
jgi:mannose-6-phosphate isomerase